VFHASIQLGRFSSPIDIKDGMAVHIDLFSEVTAVMDFLKKHLNKAFIITGQPLREERWQYPLEALREIVINMIVHRDYQHTGDSVIKIFDNYIEFFNPGPLPNLLKIC
jgi:ATP-dependent DNA helicase RecG